MFEKEKQLALAKEQKRYQDLIAKFEREFNERRKNKKKKKNK